MPNKVIDPSAAGFVTIQSLAQSGTNNGESLGTMREELRLQLGGRDDVDTTRLDRWINQGYLDLCSLIKSPRLRDTVDFLTIANQDVYQFTSDILWIDSGSVTDTASRADDGQPITPISVATWRRYPEIYGLPQHYVMYGSDIVVLWPTPDFARQVALDIYIRPPRLIGDGDQSILGEEWDEAILKKARAKAFDALLEFETAALAENVALGYIRSRIDITAERRNNEIARMTPVRTARDLTRARPILREPGDC